MSKGVTFKGWGDALASVLDDDDSDGITTASDTVITTSLVVDAIPHETTANKRKNQSIADVIDSMIDLDIDISSESIDL